jgi:hypothetical protein
MHEFHFLGIVFCWLLILMLVIGELYPTATEFEQQDVGAVDMTPWRMAKPVGLVLIVIVFMIYALFADFSILKKADDATAPPTADEPIVSAEEVLSLRLHAHPSLDESHDWSASTNYFQPEFS